MVPTYQLDELDRNILMELSDNARMPLTEVAKRLKVSAGTVHLRFEKLCQLGIVKGAQLVFDRDKIGRSLTAYVGMIVKAGSGEKVASALSQRKEVLEIHLPTGTYDLLVRVCASSVDDLHMFLSDIQKIPGFDRSQTFVVLKTLFEKEIAPVN